MAIRYVFLGGLVWIVHRGITMEQKIQHVQIPIFVKMVPVVLTNLAVVLQVCVILYPSFTFFEVFSYVSLICAVCFTHVIYLLFSGFAGTFCNETVVPDTCKLDPCLYKDSCAVVSNEELSCQCPTLTPGVCEVDNYPCPPHRYGPRCDTECIPMDACGGHYVCDYHNGDKICLEGWQGDNCNVRNFTEIGTDPECPATGDCLNGGTCFNGSCCCVTGFVGERCQTNLCDGNLCQNGATCMPFNQTSYKCICPIGELIIFILQSICWVLIKITLGIMYKRI